MDVNITNWHSGDTALISASRKGHLDVVCALLKHHLVNANTKNKNGRTALDVARIRENDDIARLLEEHMEREKLRNEEGQKRREEEERNSQMDTERKEAMEEKRRPQELVNRKPAGSGAEHRMTRHPPALRNENSPSCDDSSVEVVHELLQHNKVGGNLQCSDGATALYLASEQGHVEVVQELLQDDKVDVNVRNTDGKTPLFIASQNGHLHVVQEFLQNDKVEVNAQCTDGATALHTASQYGHAEVVRLLRQHNKVDVNARCINSLSQVLTSGIVMVPDDHIDVTSLAACEEETIVCFAETAGLTCVHGVAPKIP